MIYCFGEFELDGVQLQLRRRGIPVPVEPRPLELLLYLVENRWRTVSKEELAERVWKLTAISDQAVAGAKCRIIKALGDQDGAYIRALNGGYRFVAPVVEIPKQQREDEIFVGHAEELARLYSALDDAISGNGSLLLLEGEHGLGKTYTAQRLLGDAVRRQAKTFFSSPASYDATPVFSIWVRSFITELLRTDPILTRNSLDLATAETIAALVPELYGIVDGLKKPVEQSQVPTSPESDQERQAAIACLGNFILNFTRDRPLVVVFDDLHEADRSLCAFLVSLSRRLAGAKCLLVGAYRRGALFPQHPLIGMLGAIDGAPTVRTVKLNPLTIEDIKTYLELRAKCTDPRVVRAVYERTEGNPLFVAKIVSHAMDESLLDQPNKILNGNLAQNIRDAIGRQIVHLSSALQEILPPAAVLGREFDMNRLQRLTGHSPQVLSELLEEAARAQIVTPVGEGIGRYRFCHGLVRETIYHGLGRFQRARLHAEVLQMLEQLFGLSAQAHVTELAYHAYEGALAGTTEDAVTYGISAARQLAKQYAYEEAARHYERVVEVMDLLPRDDERFCEVLVGLGEALVRSGEHEASKKQFQRALSVARALSSPDLFARAALGLSIPEETVGVSASPEIIKLLEEALSTVQGTLRVRVLGRLAVGLCWSADAQRRSELSAEGIELARELNDPAHVAVALIARRETEWGPDNLEERLRDDEEVIEIGRRVNHRELLLLGVSARIADLMELRGLNHVEADILEFAKAAEQLQQPRYLWRVTALQTLQAWSRGDFHRAESLIRETLQFGERTPGSQPGQVIAVQTWRILAERGRLEEMRPRIEAFVREFATIPSWRCALAQVYVECGFLKEAKRTFETVAKDEFAILPCDRYWIPGICIAAEVCAALNDSSRARLLYRLLLPYEDRYVVIGPTAACLGSVARYLGLLASTSERWGEAAHHFERALAANEHIAPMLVRTQYEYALTLLRRGRRSDLKKVAQVLTRAYEAASSMEMEELARKIQDLLRQSKKSA